MDYSDVLSFWFEKVSPKQHYVKDPDFDFLIKEQFEGVYWNIMEGKTEEWRDAPEGRLAEIIVLDQFARNMFRDDEQAFLGDELALSLAEEAIAVGDDMKVKDEYRVFFYMPFMHSESKEVHMRAVKIFKEYGNTRTLDYEMKHKAIIDEFGRYPHRNTALGRESTPEEIRWLKESGGF